MPCATLWVVRERVVRCAVCRGSGSGTPLLAPSAVKPEHVCLSVTRPFASTDWSVRFGK
jgi:hypothetical protein